ncbi:MAG TPA: zf-HC2 domain-containing protein, partial [Steroidobacteraceae bacterium]|nr:zf-HC2 domain-containing protein [Steroidobacteraceae bacterium]
MNCQDIAQILDDGDTRRLDTGLRRAVEAHIAGCPECARDWHNHDHLTTRSLPAMPPVLVARCRELTACATPAGRSQRTGKRYIVVGALAALAAAAAMLVIGLRNAPEELAAQPEVALQPA